MENKSKNILIVLLALVVVVLVVFLVLNKNKKEKIVNEEVKGEIVLADLEEKIKIEAPKWSNYWIGEDTGSNLSMFVKSGENRSITDTEYPYDFEANKLREKNIYIYSSDKTKILDPKGGMELFEKEGKVIEAYDVDSSVKLIDVKTSKFKQILICGTPCGFSDAVWVDDNSFVVLGQSRGKKGFDDCKIYEECQAPLLYVFDLKKNEYTLYKGPERLFVIEKEEVSTTKDTYTYKNHGFTIELPKGYIPHEEKAEGGPATMITLPNKSGINYLTDMNWWNKVKYFENKVYLGDEKIGETIFKFYKNDNVITYFYQKGNVGYEFYGDKELLKTFKFVGWN